MAEPIDAIWVVGFGPRNHKLDGSRSPIGRGSFGGKGGVPCNVWGFSAVSCATMISCLWQTCSTRCITANGKRSDSAHAQYSASHYIVMKRLLLLGLAAEYRSRRCVWSTLPPTVRSLTLTGELPWQHLRLSAVPGMWLCLPKFKWFTWLNHAPFRDALPSKV